MRKNRLAEITIILGIILVTLVSFVGVYVQNQTIMENKVNEFKFGEELGGYIEVVFATENDLTEEKMLKSKEIMDGRIEDIGLKEYSVYQNTENGNILVQLPNNTDVSYVANCLYPEGKFELVDAETKEVFLNSDDIETAYTAYNTTETGATVYIVIKFDEEGTKKLEDVSGKYLAKEHEHKEGESEEEHNDTGPKISLFLDGETLISTNFGEKITSGELYITLGNSVTDETTLLEYVKEATRISSAIKYGQMPLKYSIDSNTYISSNIMENDLKYFAYGVGVLVIIAIAVLCIKYKKIGMLASLAFVGCIAIYMLIIRYTDSTITLNSIGGIILVLMLDYVFTVKIAKNINSDDKLPEVKSKFKKQIIDFIWVLAPMLILTVVSAFAGISSLGIVLFWGIATMLLYNVLVTKNLFEARTRKY